MADVEEPESTESNSPDPPHPTVNEESAVAVDEKQGVPEPSEKDFGVCDNRVEKATGKEEAVSKSEKNLEPGQKEEEEAFEDNRRLAPDSSEKFTFPESFLANGLLFDAKLDSVLLDTLGSFEDHQPPLLGPPLTFRSLLVGSVVACFGAAIYQVYVLKPVLAVVSNTFMVLTVFSLGRLFAAALPQSVPQTTITKISASRRSLVGRLKEGTVGFINPGPFSLAEHAAASMIAMAGANGSLAVQALSVQWLYYDTKVDTMTSLLFLFSTTCFGCAIAGLFRRITVRPSRWIYPSVLPILSLIRGLHNGSSHREPTKWFSFGFVAMFAYEVLPAYLFPLLNGINIFCLASQSASSLPLIDAFTSLFGGASGNEGLGLFSFSFDWQFIGSTFMHLPFCYQINVCFGYLLCYAIVMGIYYCNIWNAFNLPILSTTVFDYGGMLYNQTAILDNHFTVIPDAVAVNGFPSLTGSFLWANIASNLGVGSLIAHACCFLGVSALWPFKGASVGEMAKYPRHLDNVPTWWYSITAVLAFFGGLTVVVRQRLYLSHASYILGLLAGVIATPFANALAAHMGHWILPTHIAKMVGSLILPHRPLDILYFSTWSEAAVGNALFYTSQLKLGQYLHLPARVVFFTQIYGLLLGALVNYSVMTRIVEHQADTFTSALGTNIWNGQVPQILNSEILTWSLAKEIYSTKGPYFVVPLSLLLGAAITTLQAALKWCFPNRLRVLNGSSLMLPVVFMYSSIMTFGITSSVISSVLIGLVSQLWLRYRYAAWFNNLSLILGSAFDGGAQSMLLVLSFTVLGGIKGSHKPFLQWEGNPVVGNVDYCNGNGALDQ